MSQNVALKGQSVAAMELARGSTVTAAASKAGVDRRTVQRWVAEDEAFKRSIDNLRGRLIAEAVGVLVNNSRSAAETLAELSASGKPATRLQAARSVLGFAQSMHSDEIFEKRLAALEERMGVA